MNGIGEELRGPRGGTTNLREMIFLGFCARVFAVLFRATRGGASGRSIGGVQNAQQTRDNRHSAYYLKAYTFIYTHCKGPYLWLWPYFVAKRGPRPSYAEGRGWGTKR